MNDKYLQKDHGVVDCSDINEQMIEDHFKREGGEYFDCGQGYYQEEVYVLISIGDVFYKVELSAEIEHAKQDQGLELYSVDYISSVKYKEIPKPQPKERFSITIRLIDVSECEIDDIKRRLCGYGISYGIVDHAKRIS